MMYVSVHAVSEDEFVESVLPIHLYVSSGIKHMSPCLHHKCLYPLSQLGSQTQCFKLFLTCVCFNPRM